MVAAGSCGAIVATGPRSTPQLVSTQLCTATADFSVAKATATVRWTDSGSSGTTVLAVSTLHQQVAPFLLDRRSVPRLPGRGRGRVSRRRRPRCERWRHDRRHVGGHLGAEPLGVATVVARTPHPERIAAPVITVDRHGHGRGWRAGAHQVSVARDELSQPGGTMRRTRRRTGPPSLLSTAAASVACDRRRSPCSPPSSPPRSSERRAIPSPSRSTSASACPASASSASPTRRAASRAIGCARRC